MNEKQLKRELALTELRGTALELLASLRNHIADYWLEFDLVSGLKSQAKLKYVIDGYKKMQNELLNSSASFSQKKFAVQIKPDCQPIRVDASSIEKAREIAERVFGSIHDIYQLFDWVQSPAMLSENAG